MSRIAERLASRVKSKSLVETFAGPTSYATGGSVYNSTILKQIERATIMQVTGGYSGEVVTGSVSGNAFKIKLYTGTATGAIELANAINLITSSISALIEGF